MKRKGTVCVLVLLLLLTSCAVTQSQHQCAHICQRCGLCTNAACGEVVCGDKCPGFGEHVPQFCTGDYITAAEEHISTGSVMLDLGEHIYVRDNLAELTETTVATIEKVTGLNFAGNGMAQANYPDGKLHVNISWKQVRPGAASPDSDLGNAWTTFEKHVYLSPGDLFVGNGCTLIHELCHLLQFCQSGWFHKSMLNEGFAEYTTYQVLQQLQQSEPEMLMAVGSPNELLMGLQIQDYALIYEKPVEYWLGRSYVVENYTVGFRFAAYLHDVYGDYSGWIGAYEVAYPYRESDGQNGTASADREIAILKKVYGEQVLEGFYPWLREHEASFDPVLPGWLDLREVAGANWYPTFSMEQSKAELTGLQYRQLYLNLEPMRKYLSAYKGFDAGDLRLVLSEAVPVRLYRADGGFSEVCTAEPIPLDGIICIQLMGEGSLDCLRVEGAFCGDWQQP